MVVHSLLWHRNPTKTGKKEYRLQNLLKYMRVSMHQGQYPTATNIPLKWTFSGYIAFILCACPIVTLPKVLERLRVYCEAGEKEGKSAS